MKGIKGKNAEIEVQFNWIFILVVGAIILAFFIFIVTKQKQVSDRKLASDLLSDMDLIIVGQGVSVGSTKTLELSELEIRFTCEDYSMMGVPKGTGNSIIFSPSTIKSATLIAFTRSWDVPFRAANFIYLTAPDLKYYLIGGQIAATIKSGLPDKMDIEVISNNNLLPAKFQDYQHIRLVYFTDSFQDEQELQLPAGLGGFKDSQVSALYIGTTNADKLDGQATMYFYVKQGSKLVKEGEFQTFGKEAVYGAILADSHELYACNMKKALNRMEIVASIYKSRLEGILSDLPIGDPCAGYYQPTELQDIIDSVTTKPNSANLFIYAKQIADMNDRTIFASCPEIY